MFDDEDLSLLEGLTEEELQLLSAEVDPDQSLLNASERCSYKTNRPDTRMYHRDHLMDFMEKLAAESTVGNDYVPYKKKQQDVETIRRGPSPLPAVQLSIEESEELSQMSETELMELAAYIGATNVLTQDQIHAVEVGKRPEGSAFKNKMIVKASIPTTNVPKEPEQDLDVLTLKRLLKEGNVSVITINNQPELESDAFDEILMSLDENRSLRHLSLANTGMTDKVAKPLSESVECNTVLETLNVESNYISPECILDLVKAVSQHKSLRELRIANQKVRLGLQYEEKIANSLLKNETLLRIGLTVENAGPRNKIDRCLIRNNDKLRQARQQGENVYNFNDIKNIIKSTPQPWLKTRGIFQSGELRIISSENTVEEDAKPMSRLKKTGYTYEKDREIPAYDLYEEEGITQEEAVQLRAQQMQDGIEKQVKQSSMLGELTELLAKRKSQQVEESVEDVQVDTESMLDVAQQVAVKQEQPQQSIQSSVQQEMAAALLERQRKFAEQEEKDEENEEEEREERRRRRRGRGRRREDDQEYQGEQTIENEPDATVSSDGTSVEKSQQQEMKTDANKSPSAGTPSDKVEETEAPPQTINEDESTQIDEYTSQSNNENVPKPTTDEDNEQETPRRRSRRRRSHDEGTNDDVDGTRLDESPQSDRRQRRTRNRNAETTVADEDGDDERRSTRRSRQRAAREQENDDEAVPARTRSRRREASPEAMNQSPVAPTPSQVDNELSDQIRQPPRTDELDENSQKMVEDVNPPVVAEQAVDNNNNKSTDAEADIEQPMSLRERRRLKAAGGY